MSAVVHSHWTFFANPKADLFAYCEEIMQAILNQETRTNGFSDSAVSVDTVNGVVEIEANGAGQNLLQAIAVTQATVLAALRSVGIGSPDWPIRDEVMWMVLKDFQAQPVEAP